MIESKSKYSDVAIRGRDTLYDGKSVIQSILTSLYTVKGERIFRPNVGCNLEDILWREVDDLSALDLKMEIKKAILQDGRCSIKSLDVNPEPNNGRFSISVVVELESMLVEDSFYVNSKNS